VASNPVPSSKLWWPKQLLFAGLFILLVLPALQAKFHFVKMPELGGYAERAPRADFDLEGLRKNTFQSALEKYLEDRIGFREWMIQLRNQLAYSVFKVGRANQIVIGEDQVLFQTPAIDSDFGADFVGEKEVEHYVRQFKDLQDSLAARGTLLVYAIAPSKPGVYPKMLPPRFRGLPRHRSNYTAYREKMAAMGVNLVDFGALFRQWKDTSTYPLFPRGGIHWSIWGRTLAADTLLRYLRQRGHLAIPEFRIAGRETSLIPRESDNDIAKALNLLHEPKAYLMAYPNLKFIPATPLQHKPNILVTGDSFGEGLLPYLEPICSPDSRFWYYNQRVSWPGVNIPQEVGDVGSLDKREQIKGRDIILVVYCEPNLIRFDRNFTNDLYISFHPFTEKENAEIKRIENQLLADTATANRIWRKSYTQGIEAKYLIYQEARAIFDKVR
jgi:hypothetical protein